MIFLKVLIGIIVVLVVCLILFGIYRHIKTQSSAHQKTFLQGKVPNELPNGLYKGSVPGYTFPWKGKKFNREKGSGINIFNENGKTTQQYPFKLYTGKGLADKNLEVIKIDYNLPQNPLWLRFIVDEIVEVKKDTYLGKLIVNVSLFPIALGYFELERSM